MGYGFFAENTTFRAGFPLFLRAVLKLQSPLRQPCREPGCVHDEHTGTVGLAQLGGMVNVAEQPAVVDQEPGRHRVQVLLYLQVVIVPNPAFRAVPAVRGVFFPRLLPGPPGTPGSGL